MAKRKYKVKITKMHGQTGLRKIGTILHVYKEVKDRWLALDIAELVESKKKSDGNKSKQNEDGDTAD